MINFNLFVLPFFLGLIYVILAIGKSWYKWIRALPRTDKIKLQAGIRHPALMLKALTEIFMEGLIHRRMWKKNPLLGYMHMSFALGWFLLIIFGNIESRYYSGTHLNAPYYPIFLKFFIHDPLVLFFETQRVPGFFRFLMDFLLLYVLSGLLLALFKRKKSRWFGMQRTTTYQLTDRVALVSLWLIFPMRLLAESFTAGHYGSGGGFMTQPLGNMLAAINPLPSDAFAYALWWGYSMVLGLFFVTLPYSRYMHIPTEMLLIFFRHFGIQPRKWLSSFSETEVNACSRCGVCIDVCQMNSAGIHDAQAVYFIRGVRDQYVPADVSNKCMVCGRCQEVCPVGIRTDALRLIKRRELNAGQPAEYSYLASAVIKSTKTNLEPATPSIAYFSGCMSHLTPSVIYAMKAILNKSGLSWTHLDADRSICCGRPLMIAGKDRQAEELMLQNKSLIKASGADLLVTSCPICYRVFREEYALQIKVIHHSQFLLELIKTGKIPLQGTFRNVVYHDPCDLGRGTRVYEAPREVLAKVADLVTVSQEGSDALCCGGSLGIMNISQDQRNTMSKEVIEVLLKDQPEMIATGCPLCKKTLAKQSPVPVRDIAELVQASMPA